MRGINPGEVWIIDFGMAAKVRPALLLTGEPAVDELDLVTVLLHTTALRGNRRVNNLSDPFSFLERNMDLTTYGLWNIICCGMEC